MTIGLKITNGTYIGAIASIHFFWLLSFLICAQNISLSVVEFHSNPNAFITSSFPKLNNNFLSTSSSGSSSSNAG
jgi:hypothetical protein